jgi:hypothetical protein
MPAPPEEPKRFRYVVVDLKASPYSSRERQRAAILGYGYRYKGVAPGWHRQRSGQSGCWKRSHEATGRPVGRPRFGELREFGRLTLRGEFAGLLNGYSIEDVHAVLRRRGKPRSEDLPLLEQAATAVVTLVDGGRRRAALAEAIGIQRKSVDRLFRRGQSRTRADTASHARDKSLLLRPVDSHSLGPPCSGDLPGNRNIHPPAPV